MKNNIEHQYLKLVKDILENGSTKETRNGGTISVFGRQIRHDMKLGFPLLTTKKTYWKGIVTELLWFLRGDTNIKYLIDNDCHIWTGDAIKNYRKKEAARTEKTGQTWIDYTESEFEQKILEDENFAEKWGDLGPIYGKQWREWQSEVAIPTTLKIDDDDDDEPLYIKGTRYIDQIQNLINDLRTNPDSRRLMVNAWNVGELDSMTLPPCHYSWQVYTRELTIYERANIARVSTKNKQYGFEVEDHWIEGESDFEIKRVLNNLNIPTRAISLMWNQRSVDTPLGLPFNIASYALLLEILAKMTNMVPDELIGNLGDCHIYKNQIEGIKEQLTREPYPLPKLVFNNQIHLSDNIDEFLNSCLITDFTIEDYQSHPTIKLPLSN